jgi:hypothetical protein
MLAAVSRDVSRPLWHFVLFTAGVIAAAAVVLLLMGREPVSKSGRIMLWSGDVASSENSQQIADWYTFSHITP